MRSRSGSRSGSAHGSAHRSGPAAPVTTTSSKLPAHAEVRGHVDDAVDLGRLAVRPGHAGLVDEDLDGARPPARRGARR